MNIHEKILAYLYGKVVQSLLLDVSNENVNGSRPGCFIFSKNLLKDDGFQYKHYKHGGHNKRLL